MIILALKTDQPLAAVYLYKDETYIASKQWEAHRTLAKELLQTIVDVVQSQNLQLQQVEGIVLYKGPGSFTGLRIGGSVTNALGYGLSVPVVSVGGEDWLLQGIRRLLNNESDTIAEIEYGGSIHITAPKK